MGKSIGMQMAGWLRNLFKKEAHEAGIVTPKNPSAPAPSPSDNPPGFQLPGRGKKRLTTWGRIWDYCYWGVSEPGRIKRSFGLWRAEPYLGVSPQGARDQFGNRTMTEKQVERALRRLVRLHYNNGENNVKAMKFYCYDARGNIDMGATQKAQIILMRMSDRREFQGMNLSVSYMPMMKAEPFYYLTKPLQELFHKATNFKFKMKIAWGQKWAGRRDRLSGKHYVEDPSSGPP